MNQLDKIRIASHIEDLAFELDQTGTSYEKDLALRLVKTAERLRDNVIVEQIQSKKGE